MCEKMAKKKFNCVPTKKNTIQKFCHPGKFVGNSIFDISFNFLKPKNEDLNCLKKYANLKKYLKI